VLISLARDEILSDQQRDVTALLYFGLDVFFHFEARVPELTQCTLSTAAGGKGCVSNSKTLVSSRQNTASPVYNDDISFLFLQYLISVSCAMESIGLISPHSDGQ
jgi:hypothetical protein